MMYTRKRNKRTNYKKRLAYLLSRTPRLVIRRSNTKISAQIIEYHADGDKIIVSANSQELANMGYRGRLKNIPSAYLTGLLIAKKAKKIPVQKVIPDIGFYTPIKGSFPFALIKGIKDGGITIDADESILPEESRLKGEHISSFAKLHNKNVDLINLPQEIEKIKQKLLEK